MAFLTETQVTNILERMVTDKKQLAAINRVKKSSFMEYTVPYNNVEEYEKLGWSRYLELKTRVKMQKPKPTGMAFEDKVWTLFYSLGFKCLNRDEHLTIKWGEGEHDQKQIDVLAVGEDAIFVVECKATSKTTSQNFKIEIENIEHYKEGIIKSLRQIYGEKKVKFIFATENYIVGKSDADRMKERKIFHMNEKAVKYIQNLQKKYKSCVLYQFYGLMFKNELISSKRIRVPALKGSMGGYDYYMMSIEPEILLRMGFVLHRTKVNDTMSDPTYQRLLSPSRLPGITKHIQNGGYFPNSLIINFDTTIGKKMKIWFEPTKDEGDNSNSKLGILNIPNAYGIAYIIDGQHRLYGYAGTEYKYTNTIPVVAFVNMDSREQLKIFMDINENQKAVSKDLRLDLDEDVNWKAPQVDSRIKALRSSTIKALSMDSGSVLFNKISVGEDKAELNPSFFADGLIQSSLLPKANKTSYIKDMDVCLYETNRMDHNEAMLDCKKRIVDYIRECYNYMYRELDEKLFKDFILYNRGVFAFVALIGSINKHLVNNNLIAQFAPIKDRMEKVVPFLDALILYLSNLPDKDERELRFIQGQQAQTIWLRRFQNAIHMAIPEYKPEGLDQWLICQDEGFQQKAKEYIDQIFSILKISVLDKLQELYEDRWESYVKDTKKECYMRVYNIHADEDDFNPQEIDWTDGIDLGDLKNIIEKNWATSKEDDNSFVPFKKLFAIKVNDKFGTRAEKLLWLSDVIKYKKSIENPKAKKLSPQQVDELELIYNSLNPEV